MSVSESISVLLLLALLLLDLLLADELLPLELDVLPLFFHVQVYHLIELLFIVCRVHATHHQRLTTSGTIIHIIVGLGLIEVTSTSLT